MPKGVYIRNEATIKRIREFRHSEETKRRISLTHKGKKHTIETKAKIAETMRNRWKNPVMKERMVSRMYGVKHDEESRRKNSEARKREVAGGKHIFWKGGITPINKKIRNCGKYRSWKRAVFERDNYACVWCKVKNEDGKTIKLNADHIKPFAIYPELRFAIDNGRTLCVPCHKTTDTYGHKANTVITQKTLE